MEAFTVFSPRSFSSFYKTYPTTVHVERKVAKFCKTYGIDSNLCAKELFSFAGAFEKLISSEKPYDFNDKGFQSDSSDSDYSDYSDCDYEIEENEKDCDKSFMDCLKLLTHKKYRLIDAYPTLVRVYAISVAIPITSCSAERSFSTLKRVKTRLRSTMSQNRLEGLLLMSIERKILLNLNRDKIIDNLAKTSKELENALT